MQGSLRGKPKASLMLGFAFCLLALVMLVSCQSVPDDKALMPGIESVEKISSPEDFTWSTDLECAPCHSPEAQTAAASACTGFSDARSSCLTCHNATEELTVAHQDILGVKPDSETKHAMVESDACMSCHSISSLVEKTIGSTALIDKNNTTINPHALLKTKGHDKIDCIACHTMHETVNALEATPKICQNCHHTDTYDCDSCH